ncbi:MAG: hypothetical protein R2991_05370 [Thermoanaerobaculia bacterium]
MNNETRGRIEEKVLAEYHRVVEGIEPEPQAERPAAPRPATPVAVPPPAAAASATQPEEREDPGTTLDEVAEMHLRDSFWTT